MPLPSILDFTGGDGFGVALGVGVEFEGAYDGSDETELGVEPAGAVYYRKGEHLFFWEGMELGWRSRLADVWLVQAGLRNEGGLEPGDSDDGKLAGIKPRDSHVVGFLEVRRAVGDEWRNWVAARLMGGPSDFGVTAADAVSSGLRQTTLSGGYRSTGVQLVHRRNLTRKLHAVAQAGVEFYSGDIGDSPIARQDYEFELSLSLLWRF